MISWLSFSTIGYCNMIKVVKRINFAPISRRKISLLSNIMKKRKRISREKKASERETKRKKKENERKQKVKSGRKEKKTDKRKCSKSDGWMVILTDRPPS